MNDNLVLEIGLKAAFEKVRGRSLVEELRMTDDEAARYWFGMGFKMGHSFARFVDKQKENDANIHSNA